MNLFYKPKSIKTSFIKDSSACPKNVIILKNKTL